MGCAASVPAAGQVHPVADEPSEEAGAARKHAQERRGQAEELGDAPQPWEGKEECVGPVTSSPHEVEQAATLSHDGLAPERQQQAMATIPAEAEAAEPVERAVSLAWLLKLVKDLRGTKCSWKVNMEFLSPEDGGGASEPIVVDESNLEEHREKRRAAERARSGKPVKVHYCDIRFEHLYTTDLVEWVVRKVARESDMSYAAAMNAPVGAPTYFISHAWSSSFVDLVASVDAALAGAAQDDTFVWLDIFAINQNDMGGVSKAMQELDDGRTLARTVETARATLVVLDKERVIPLTRLWCLYEIGSTPPDKLELVTHGFAERDVTQHIRNIDAESALCFKDADKKMIHDEIVNKFGFGSLRRFTEELKLRFLLRPMGYKADLDVLKERGLANTYRLDALRKHVAENGGRVACIVGGPGQGKSSVASAALSLAHASHFCKRDDIRRQNVLEIVRSLAFQLAHHFHEVRGSLLSLDEDTIATTLADGDAAVNELLIKPLAQIDDDASRHWTKAGRVSKRHAVVLIDAMDESDDIDNLDNSITRILCQISRSKSRNLVSFILTSRPDSALSEGSRAGRSNVRIVEYEWRGKMLQCSPADILHSGKDGKSYLATWPTQNAGADEASKIPKAWIEALRCNENLMTYQLVVRKFLERFPDVIARTEPPSHLDAAYHLWFDHSGAAKDDSVRQLLRIILAAREPLSAAHISRLNLLRACKLLPGWGMLFEERNHLLQTFHLSLREFLSDARRSREHVVDIAAGHNKLSLSSMSILQSGHDFGPPFEYAIRHGHVHLAHTLTSISIRDIHNKVEEDGPSKVFHAWLSGFLQERNDRAMQYAPLTSHSIMIELSTWEANALAAKWLLCQVQRFRSVLFAREMMQLENILKTCISKKSSTTQSSHEVSVSEYHAMLDFVSVIRWGIESRWIPYEATLNTYMASLVFAWSMPVTSVFFNSAASRSLSKDAARQGYYMPISVGEYWEAIGDDKIIPGDWTRFSIDDEEGVALRGHLHIVTSVCFDPKGKRIITSSLDRTLRLWNSMTGQCIGVIDISHYDDGCPISPQDLAGSIRTQLRVERNFSDRNNFMLSRSSAVFSEDGTRIISFHVHQQTVCVWDALTYELLEVAKGIPEVLLVDWMSVDWNSIDYMAFYWTMPWRPTGIIDLPIDSPALPIPNWSLLLWTLSRQLEAFDESVHICGEGYLESLQRAAIAVAINITLFLMSQIVPTPHLESESARILYVCVHLLVFLPTILYAVPVQLLKSIIRAIISNGSWKSWIIFIYRYCIESVVFWLVNLVYLLGLRIIVCLSYLFGSTLPFRFGYRLSDRGWSIISQHCRETEERQEWMLAATMSRMGGYDIDESEEYMIREQVSCFRVFNGGGGRNS
ncbi:EF-hand domain-containing protein [Pseudoscourfieldia marina]